MAVSAIVAAISTGAGVITGTIALTSAFTYFLVSTAMGAALNALTPKPSFSAGQQGYSLRGESGAALDHQIIYGEARVGGARVYDSATGDSNQYLHRVLAFAGHEVDSYQEIYLNDEVVTVDAVTFLVTSPEQYAGKVRIKQYVGTAAQAADTDLIADTASLALDEGRWTADHKLSGIAYLYVRFEYDANAFPNGVPSVSAKIRGKKVFNPVTSTTAWSDNPALCIRDYLTSDYGLNQPAGRIDDTLVSVAVGVCNQVTESEKRYTCNGAFRTGAAPSDILTNLLTSMGGLLWYGQGKWRMKAAAWSAPTVSFDEDDLRSAISLSTRHSRRDNFNSVKGVFAGDDTDWQPTDYPEVTDPAFLVADNNVPNVLDFPLPFTSSSLTAQRVARIALNRNREQLTFSAAFGMRAFQVQVGDFINITNTRFGWTNKAFEVVEWTFGLADNLDIQVNMTLREISEGVFTGADGSVFEQNNTTLPNPFTGLTINNLVASGGGRTQGDGTFINSAILNWDDVSSAFLDYYEVEWKALSDSIYNATTTDQSDIELSPLVDNIEYIFRVRAVSVAGIKGPYSTVQFTGGGDETAPGLPTNISATGHFEYISIDWTNPADADLNYVEIWEADSNSSAAATKVGISGGNTFQRTNLGLNITKFYFLKAVDYSGNASAFTAGVSATTTYLDDDAFANGIYSLFTEQGLYAIEDVTSLPLAGDFEGQKVFNRTDGKLYQWTGSAWELVIAEPDSFIASDKIIANTITGGLLATSGIITNSAQINDAVVARAKIEDAAISTAKIGTNMVTFPQFAGGVTQTDYPNSQVQLGPEITIATITVNQSGAPAWIFGESMITHADGSGGTSFSQYGTFNYRIKANGTLITGVDAVLIDGANSPSFVLDTTYTSSGSTTYELIFQTAGGSAPFFRILNSSIFFVELKR